MMLVSVESYIFVESFVSHHFIHLIGRLYEYTMCAVLWRAPIINKRGDPKKDCRRKKMHNLWPPIEGAET